MPISADEVTLDFVRTRYKIDRKKPGNVLLLNVVKGRQGAQAYANSVKTLFGKNKYNVDEVTNPTDKVGSCSNSLKVTLEM